MLLRARKVIGIINTGEAHITPGFKLHARYVIHTVGPVWYDGCHGEVHLLKQCYEQSLTLAWRHRVKSIALPLISTGNYGFPKKLVLQIAVETIREFLKEHEMMVYLVVLDKESFELSGELVNRVRSYIDEADAQNRQKAEYSFSVSCDFDFVKRQFETLENEDASESISCPNEFSAASAPKDHSVGPVCGSEPKIFGYSDKQIEECGAPQLSKGAGIFRSSIAKPKKETEKTDFDADELNELLKAADVGFSETLLKLIDQSGKKDSDIYKRANVDRKLFSKIRNNPQYKPSKATAVAFAIALELDLEETRDFIGRAGYALSRSNKFDIIIEYFITHERYDIYEINLMLFEFDQNLLGA